MRVALKHTAIVILLAACAMLASCGAFDSGTPWTGGPYMLVWIDDPEKVTLSYDEGGGSSSPIIDQCVFEVGWDGKFVVAKQHPGGNKLVTQYFIIDSTKDASKGNHKDALMGPLTKEEFDKKSMDMKLPAFTTLLESLK